MPEVANVRIDREPGGILWRLLRMFRRNFAAAIANWLEQQGGFPLFTVEGDEPEPADHSWALPRNVSKTISSSGLPIVDLGGSFRMGDDGNSASSTDLDSEGSSRLEVPNFLLTTKFFACLDLMESQELFDQTSMVQLQQRELLFSTGDSGETGIYVVVEGTLDIFLEDGGRLLPTNTLSSGESVGDLDVLDGVPRSVTAVAGAEGALLVQVSRALFIDFVSQQPRTLQIYLQKAMARLWRVAHFVLSDVLDLPLEDVLDMKYQSRWARAASMPSLSSLDQPGSAFGMPKTAPTVHFSSVPTHRENRESLGGQESSAIDAASMRRGVTSREGLTHGAAAAGRKDSGPLGPGGAARVNGTRIQDARTEVGGGRGGGGVAATGRKDSGPLGPGIDRTMSTGMKAPRFRPQLASVTESRADSRASSASSSALTEVTEASFANNNIIIASSEPQQLPAAEGSLGASASSASGELPRPGIVPCREESGSVCVGGSTSGELSRSGPVPPPGAVLCRDESGNVSVGSASGELSRSGPVLSPFEAASWGLEPDSPREGQDMAFRFQPWGQARPSGSISDSHASYDGTVSARGSSSIQGWGQSGVMGSVPVSNASSAQSSTTLDFPAFRPARGSGASPQDVRSPFASVAQTVDSDEDDDGHDDGGASFLSAASSLDDGSSYRTASSVSERLDTVRSGSQAPPPGAGPSRLGRAGSSAVQAPPPVRTGIPPNATGTASGVLDLAASNTPSVGPGNQALGLGSGLKREGSTAAGALTRGSLESPVAVQIGGRPGAPPEAPDPASPVHRAVGCLESRRSMAFGQRPGDELRLDDAAAVSNIARTLNRLTTMSMPVRLLGSSAGSAPPPIKVQEPYQAREDGVVSQGPSCSRSTPLYRSPFLHKPHAALHSAWDVVSVEEAQLTDNAWSSLCCIEQGVGQHIKLERGSILHDRDDLSRKFYVLLEGHLLAERPRKGHARQEVALVSPGSLVNCAAFISSTRARMSLRAAETCHLVSIGATELDKLVVENSEAFLELLLVAARALGPVIRKFISLGLNRQWLTAGSSVFRQGEEARSLYMVISGRLRILREDPASRPPVVVEDEASRGESVGAVWALSGGAYDTTALCVRDSELVRMSKGAFEVVSTQYPKAAARMLEAMAKRLATASAARARPNQVDVNGRMGVTASDAARTQMDKRRKEIVTIALLPAGASLGAAGAVRRLGTALKTTLEELFGPTLHLMPSGMQMMFPTDFERMHISFYRSKITSWMASQEEEYRFIILEAETGKSPWSRICVSHADCILLVGAEDAQPDLNRVEQDLVWAPMGPAICRGQSLDMALGASLLNPFGLEPADGEADGLQNAQRWASHMRRVELVLLHPGKTEPQGTAAWLGARPHLARHHHVRLSHPGDLARVARWMAGKAVGVVLSGGGSRGLAHLGILHALDSAGVPIDVIGGTSQGAFMAALYAQGLAWDEMHTVVRKYAKQMGSVHQLISDITLPLISLFSGAGFDRVVRESFAHGPQRIEDLWLRFFCMSTNLSRGEPTAHDRGLLWKLVRASMTIVGLVPPVYEEGELLIDGGYLNNIPVDVMRSMGVDMVVVVDVEDKDTSLWQNLTPYDGGVSGWSLLWDRWCPIPSLRFGIKMPSYNQIISALTWMSHTQNLRRMSREYLIDLYLHPPVGRFRILDYHLMDRIVRDSNRYAWAALSEWQVRRGVTQKGMFKMEPARHPVEQAKPAVIRRSYSVACMTQLQAKQLDVFGTGPDTIVGESTGGTSTPGEVNVEIDLPEGEAPAVEAPAAAVEDGWGGVKIEEALDAVSEADASAARTVPPPELLQQEEVSEEGAGMGSALEVSDVSMCGFAASGIVSPRAVSPVQRNPPVAALPAERRGRRVSLEEPAALPDPFSVSTSGLKNSLPLLSSVKRGLPATAMSRVQHKPLLLWPGGLVEDISTASLAVSGLTGPATTMRGGFQGVMQPAQESVLNMMAMGRRNSLYPQHASGSLDELLDD